MPQTSHYLETSYGDSSTLEGGIECLAWLMTTSGNEGEIIALCLFSDIETILMTEYRAVQIRKLA